APAPRADGVHSLRHTGCARHRARGACGPWPVRRYAGGASAPRGPRSIRQFPEAQVAEAHRAVVALEEDRPRFVHVFVDFAAGGAVADDVVVNLFAVEDHGDFVGDDRGLDGLPLVARLRGELRWRGVVVDCPVARERRLAGLVVAEDLDLVPATEV